MLRWLLDLFRRPPDPPSSWLPSEFEVEMECPDTQPTSPGALDGAYDTTPAGLHSAWGDLPVTEPGKNGDAKE